MFPWQVLSTHAVSVMPSGVSVYESATSQVVPPALVIRPDAPWREQAARGSGGSFCIDRQHYVAVAVVQAATPDDGTKMLYRMHSALIASLPEGWTFVSVGGVFIDESTGSQLLACAMRLQYDNSDGSETEEEES